MLPIETLVTREDVLAGKMTINLLNKVGDPVVLELKALPRSKYMELVRKHPEGCPEKVFALCAGIHEDELDQLDWDSQMEGHRIAQALCQGLPSAKNFEREIRAQAAAAETPSTGTEQKPNSSPSVGGEAKSPS